MVVVVTFTTITLNCINIQPLTTIITSNSNGNIFGLHSRLFAGRADAGFSRIEEKRNIAIILTLLKSVHICTDTSSSHMSFVNCAPEEVRTMNDLTVPVWSLCLGAEDGHSFATVTLSLD